MFKSTRSHRRVIIVLVCLVILTAISGLASAGAAGVSLGFVDSVASWFDGTAADREFAPNVDSNGSTELFVGAGPDGVVPRGAATPPEDGGEFRPEAAFTAGNLGVFGVPASVSNTSGYVVELNKTTAGQTASNIQ